MDLRTSLESLLRDDYAIERELGGGGMSRVFVATEKKLGRRVVIKVLSTELAASLSTSRFEREIQLAASLQQANIVPVLTAGQVEKIPYYTMPFIEGESLRGRLARGPLPEQQALSVLRDVARALVYAHERGIVHRDIKPDNVLLSGEAAVVTDFGIAKAISAARTQVGENPGEGITQMGTAIGTPAYMAPEQAAGDPGTDHRADIYAFGCLAFELLTGRPPFHGLAPHRLMAAHMGETAPQLTSVVSGVNPVLDALVASCLAKIPEDRPATARDVLRQLESAVSSASRDSLPVALSGRHWSLPQAVGIWAGSFGAAWVLARAAVVGIGLPSWTVPLTLIAAGLGLPAVIFTWYVQHSARRALLRTPTRTPGGTAMQSTMATFALRAVPHVSWKRTWGAGAASAGVVAVGLVVVMVLRLFGIGPAASLLAAGRIGADSRVLVAEFTSNAADTSLGAVMAQAMRTSLGQSKAIQLVTPQQVSAGLRRMMLPAATQLTERVAQDLAAREGIALIVAGQLATVGNGFLVSARLVSADSGKELAALQRGANGAADLLDAIDQLARDLRSRIGESLRSVQRAPALAQATTNSLVALKEYTRGLQLGDLQGDFAGGLAHLEEAVREDSTFALAWRKIGVFASNLGRPRSQVFGPVAAAYRFRERLSGDERDEVEAYYANQVTTRGAVAAYRAAENLSKNNLANSLNQLGEYAAAESVTTGMLEEVAAGAAPIVQMYANRIVAQVSQGSLTAARETIAAMRRDFPGSYYAELVDAWIGWSAGGVDSMAVAGTRLSRSANIVARTDGSRINADLAGAGGQLGRYAELSAVADAVADSAQANEAPVVGTAGVIVATAIHRGREAWGVAQLDSLLAADVAAQRPPLDQSGLEIAAAYAQLGRPDKAKPLISEFERRSTREEQLVRWAAWLVAKGEVLLAEDRAAEALAEFRTAAGADSGDVEAAYSGRTPFRAARAFDRMGEADSAIAQFEQYLASSIAYSSAPLSLPLTLRRLGELYEAKGDLARAIAKYSEFVRLWRNADPELQPQVAEINARLQRLRAIEARRR